MLFVLLLCGGIATAIAQNAPTTEAATWHLTDSFAAADKRLSLRPPDSLNLMLMAGNTYNKAVIQELAQKITTLVTQLRVKQQRAAGQQTFLYQVFTWVTNQYCRYYTTETSVANMLHTGEFNCLTAVTLMSYLLDRLQIKHTVNEVPGHVYILAIIDGKEILLEMTDPTNGYISETNALVQRQQLYLQQSVQHAEASACTKQVWFTDLIALQYYNTAAGFYQKNQYQETLQYLYYSMRTAPTERAMQLTQRTVKAMKAKETLVSPEAVATVNDLVAMYGKQYMNK